MLLNKGYTESSFYVQLLHIKTSYVQFFEEDFMKMDLTKQPKWVQKYIEGLLARLDLSVECIDLLSNQVAILEAQKTAHNSD